MAHDLISDTEHTDIFFNSSSVGALHIREWFNFSICIGLDSDWTLVDHHDEVLASVEQERIVEDIDVANVWAEPLLFAKLDLVQLDGLHLFSVHVSAPCSWEPLSPEPILVPDGCIELDAGNLPGVNIAAEEIEPCRHGVKV